MTMLKQELKQNWKSFLIWTLSVGIMCYGCVLMYGSVENSLEQMGDLFSSLGTMSTALGMDRISLATLSGYYATEIAMLHGLGGAMFAAILGCNMLSKEEMGHTVEFLCVLPISRASIVLQKFLAIIIYLTTFQVLCTLCYMGAFVQMKEEIPMEEMWVLAGAQLMLMIEIAAICFLISAWTKKNMMGAGLGIALLFFGMDIMCRIVPAIEDLKYITPFYYANATDIFTDTELDPKMFVIGGGIAVVSYLVANQKYVTKDLQ